MIQKDSRIKLVNEVLNGMKVHVYISYTLIQCAQPSSHWLGYIIQLILLPSLSQVIKLYAWEIPFKQQVMDIRSGELNVLRSTAFLNAGSSFTWTCAPFLVSVSPIVAHTCMITQTLGKI